MPELESKWRTNMDKLAYIIAGVVGFIVLAVPLFSGQVSDLALRDAAADFRVAVQKSKDWVRTETEGTRPPDLRGDLEKQWDVGTAARIDPRWVTERAPAFLRKTKAAERLEPVHKPGVIGEISCGRDGEKKAVHLTIKGSMNIENNLVVIQSVRLFRKEGDGKFGPVRGFSATGDFVYKDHDLGPGKTYTYYVESVAQRDPSVAATSAKPLPEEMKVQKSEELGPTEPIPYDYSLAISQFEAAMPGQSPRFYARFEFWDYSAGRYERLKGGQLQILTEKQRIPDADGRWEITLVNDIDQTVTVKDLEKRGVGATETFRYRDARAARPVQCWREPLLAPALRGAAEGETEGETEGAALEGAPPREGEPEAAPPAKAPSAAKKTTSPAQPTTKKAAEKKKPAGDSSGTKTKKFR